MCLKRKPGAGDRTRLEIGLLLIVGLLVREVTVRDETAPDESGRIVVAVALGERRDERGERPPKASTMTHND